MVRLTYIRMDTSRSSGAESPKGALRCRRAGGGAESRWRPRHVLQGLHGYVDGTGVTVATSAVIQPEALPDDSSVFTSAAGTLLTISASPFGLLADLACFFFSSVTGAGALVREVIQDLTVAIGEPPRRPFEENDVGHCLSWAMDIVVVCFVLAACLFALSFASMPQECSAGDRLASGFFEALRPEDEQDDEAVLRSSDGFRMLIALTLPVLSGVAVSIRHSLVSALLCGL